MQNDSDRIKEYKTILYYMLFGTVAAVLNMICYWFAARLFDLSTVTASVIAWLFALIFSYLTNRKYVFKSHENSIKGVAAETVRFFACRFLTGIVDWICMYVFVDILKINDMFIKLLANILVGILNYFGSLFLVFKQNK